MISGVAKNFLTKVSPSLGPTIIVLARRFHVIVARFGGLSQSSWRTLSHRSAFSMSQDPILIVYCPRNLYAYDLYSDGGQSRHFDADLVPADRGTPTNPIMRLCSYIGLVMICRKLHELCYSSKVRQSRSFAD